MLCFWVKLLVLFYSFFFQGEFCFSWWFCLGWCKIFQHSLQANFFFWFTFYHDVHGKEIWQTMFKVWLESISPYFLFHQLECISPLSTNSFLIFRTVLPTPPNGLLGTPNVMLLVGEIHAPLDLTFQNTIVIWEIWESYSIGNLVSEKIKPRQGE